LNVKKARTTCGLFFGVVRGAPQISPLVLLPARNIEIAPASKSRAIVSLRQPLNGH
jgi:hypothetical protein